MWGVLLNGQAALQKPLGDVFSHAHHQQTAACAGCSQLGQGSSPGALGRRAGPVGRKPPAGAPRTFPGQLLAGGRVDVAEPAAAGRAPWETGPMPGELGLLGAAGTSWS